MNLDELEAARFVPLRGDTFRIVPQDAAPFDVELIAVREAAERGPVRMQFALEFRGGPEPPLPQRIYRVEHEALGALEIFLVPIGPDDVGHRYEAVFT